MSYEWHLRASTDLITSYEATRAGFIDLAIERNQRANPFIEQARALKVRASEATTPTQCASLTQANTLTNELYNRSESQVGVC